MPGSIEPWEPAKYPKTLRHLKAGADGDVSDIAEFPTLVFDGETSAMFYAIVRRRYGGLKPLMYRRFDETLRRDHGISMRKTRMSRQPWRTCERITQFDG
jgi:hypothetical protein